MKVIYIYIYILLVFKFLFVKSSCNSSNNGKIECTNEFETFELYNGTDINVKMDTVGGKYYFYPLKFPYKNLLCNLDIDIKFTPELPSFPKIPTTGGEFGFDTTRNQFVTFLDPGCGHFNISSENIQILSTTYETCAITNTPILDDDKGILTIRGSNLYKTSIKIYSDNIVKDSNPIGALDSSHSSVTFSVEEFLTPNNWIIEVSICGSFYKNYSYPYGLPVLTKMVGLPNDNGDNMVFTGNHLRSKYNVTGTFGNKNIECLTTNSSKNITCTIPTRKSYGSNGYNIPFTITIDGYKSNTIKISYWSPV
ncbi:hypothetical protein ACTFIY_004515 [Dictyostelium cf. discoideum]